MAYKELNPAIAINILNFNLFDQTERFHKTYHLYEDKEKFRLTDVMEFHFIEMPKLISDWQAGKLDPWNDVLARWLLMLGMVDRRKGKVYEDIFKELEEIAMKDKVLHEAFENWEVLSGTQDERIAYESRLKRIFDEEAAVIEAEIRLKEGKEKGRREGREEGRQEEKENIARSLLTEGMGIDLIMRATGLSEERIQEINKQ